MYLSTYSSLYFIIDTYHLEFSTVKVSLERSTRKTIKHKPELDAYALNPSFKTYQPILDIDKLDINIDLVAESVGMTSSVCSFIQKCYRLQELYFSVRLWNHFTAEPIAHYKVYIFVNPRSMPTSFVTFLLAVRI